MLRRLHSKFRASAKNNLVLISKMSSRCNVAVCQFTATNDKESNFQIVENLIKEAVEKEAEVVFLPEGCDFIGISADETKALAETLEGNLITCYKALAKKHNIWLSIGGFHEISRDEDATAHSKVSNSHVLIDATGEIRANYRKIHLFDVTIQDKNICLKESDVVSRGLQVTPPVNTPAGPLALSICYDLRFPELSVLQRKQGATILTYPSAFTNATGSAHWEVLLKARAIENQCYVIAAAQYGKHNYKRTSFGHSMIIDPWGRTLAECPKYVGGVDTDESVAVAQIDSQVILKVRQEMPVFQHRRDDLYRLDSVQKTAIPINDDEIYMFADKEIPGSTVFYQTLQSFAFTNIRCVVPGHVLISSKRVCRRLEDLSQSEASDLFIAAVAVQRVMEFVHSANSSTVVIQDGKHAGQTVPHVHVHILPRKPHDFDRNDDIYDALANHDQDNNPEPFRSYGEMTAEAEKLRKYFY